VPQIRVVIATAMREDAEDNGERACYIKGWGDQLADVKKVVKDAGDTDLREGGQDGQMFTEYGKAEGGGQPAKMYAFFYEKPANLGNLAGWGAADQQPPPAAAPPSAAARRAGVRLRPRPARRAGARPRRQPSSSNWAWTRGPPRHRRRPGPWASAAPPAAAAAAGEDPWGVYREQAPPPPAADPWAGQLPAAPPPAAASWPPPSRGAQAGDPPETAGLNATQLAAYRAMRAQRQQRARS
jgi:hypothetical protein